MGYCFVLVCLLVVVANLFLYRFFFKFSQMDDVCAYLKIYNQKDILRCSYLEKWYYFAFFYLIKSLYKSFSCILLFLPWNPYFWQKSWIISLLFSQILKHRYFSRQIFYIKKTYFLCLAMVHWLLMGCSLSYNIIHARIESIFTFK